MTHTAMTYHVDDLSAPMKGDFLIALKTVLESFDTFESCTVIPNTAVPIMKARFENVLVDISVNNIVGVLNTIRLSYTLWLCREAQEIGTRFVEHMERLNLLGKIYDCPETYAIMNLVEAMVTEKVSESEVVNWHCWISPSPFVSACWHTFCIHRSKQSSVSLTAQEAEDFLRKFTAIPVLTDKTYPRKDLLFCLRRNEETRRKWLGGIELFVDQLSNEKTLESGGRS
jgi:hypothetical protein